MKILITGGAGYIGSFMVKSALDKGDEVVVVDSLERGHEKVVNPKAKLVVGDLRKKEFVENIFSGRKFDAVIHFAGYISMAESVDNPYIYFENNIISSLNIIESMVNSKTNNFIFSSTAGVYGNPVKIPIKEDHPKNPSNPYGESKLMVEKILHWYRKKFGLNFTCLRYFNAAGASLDGGMGEEHSPETHLIPNAINAALNNSTFTLYGDDYDTKDGTCVRDYIHVIDLVEAHLLAITKLRDSGGGFFYNVGTGKGHSNREVLNEVEKISGSDIGVKILKRRPGDASVLIADSTQIRKALNFTPKYSDLNTIVKTAWEWHKNNSKLKINNSK